MNGLSQFTEFQMRVTKVDISVRPLHALRSQIPENAENQEKATRTLAQSRRQAMSRFRAGCVPAI